MNKMQEWLYRASHELGLRVEVDYVVKLADGRSLVAKAYFPHLSNPGGILVFDWSDTVDASARRELAATGIGTSTFGAPSPDEKFDIESYRLMFAEWGWTGPNDEKPPWIP